MCLSVVYLRGDSWLQNKENLMAGRGGEATNEKGGLGLLPRLLQSGLVFSLESSPKYHWNMNSVKTGRAGKWGKGNQVWKRKGAIRKEMKEKTYVELWRERERHACRPPRCAAATTWRITCFIATFRVDLRLFRHGSINLLHTQKPCLLHHLRWRNNQENCLSAVIGGHANWRPPWGTDL